MEKIIVEITDKRAYKILRELEELKILKVGKKTKDKKQRLSKKYAGILPSKLAEDMSRDIENSRKEWENRDS
ncbi:hypothetical protein [Gracilimonas mengyeensis]|uniref:Uncharacterized protein n=1 Tax=Gracilimonas mengyeensis TaxID=1302730 RepID=A0A521BDD2_9BACT|nr:hypothetical protein [Gracilimonas mengyeensis]SMO45082.1 hypothetical protein SAMN06265219_102205 [Gracilimonas mengyeensis]